MKSKNQKPKKTMAKLLDSNDKSVNASTVIMLIGFAISFLLLLVPIVCIPVEVFSQRTITSDLSGWAAYITASSAAAGIGGGVKGLSVWSHNKYGTNLINVVKDKVLGGDDEEEIE